MKKILCFLGIHDYEQDLSYPARWEGNAYIIKAKCTVCGKEVIGDYYKLIPSNSKRNGF